MFNFFRCLKLYIPLFDSDTCISWDHMFQHWHPEPLRNVFPKKRAATPFVFLQQIGKITPLSRWFKSWSFLLTVEVSFPTWVNGSGITPKRSRLETPGWLKLIVETWFPGYFFPQTSRVGGSIPLTPVATPKHGAVATPVQTQLEARGIPPGIPPVGNEKKVPGKNEFVLAIFVLGLSKLSYFPSKKNCGEVDGVPMTSMTIQLGSKKACEMDSCKPLQKVPVWCWTCAFNQWYRYMFFFQSFRLAWWSRDPAQSTAISNEQANLYASLTEYSLRVNEEKIRQCMRWDAERV